MLCRCTSYRSIWIGIRAGACPVAGAGAPAFAARPSIAIHIYVVYIYTPNMLCRCTR